MMMCRQNTRRYWWRLRCLILACVWLSLSGCNRPAADAGTTLVPGDVFPAPVLDHVAGGNDPLGPFFGKLLVLNIWATWCPPCRSEMPGLDRLSKTLDPKRFAVVGLSVDTDTLLASEFLLQHGITFTNVFDPGGKIVRPLGLKVYPETFIIAPDRSLLRRITGQQEWDSPKMIQMLEGLYQ